MTKEQIYERMTVEFVTPDPEIPCEFDDGQPCDLLYGKVCDARMRISERTGIDFEDRDLLAMVEGMEEIGKVLALKMYEYGVRFGGESWEYTLLCHTVVKRLSSVNCTSSKSSSF